MTPDEILEVLSSLRQSFHSLLLHPINKNSYYQHKHLFVEMSLRFISIKRDMNLLQQRFEKIDH